MLVEYEPRLSNQVTGPEKSFIKPSAFSVSQQMDFEFSSYMAKQVVIFNLTVLSFKKEGCLKHCLEKGKMVNSISSFSNIVLCLS